MTKLKREYIISPAGYDEGSYKIRQSGESLDTAEFVRDSKLLKNLFGSQSGILKVTYEATMMTEIARKIGGAEK